MAEPATLRLMAICGSLQKESSNLALLSGAAEMVPAGVELALYDGIRHIPMFNPDAQASGNPAVVVDFVDRLAASDGLLIASPEYAHGVPGSLKNALDWLVGCHDFGGIPVAMTASVPHESRGRFGLESLAHIVGVMGADVVSATAIVRGPSAADALQSVLDTLVEAARRHSQSHRDE